MKKDEIDRKKSNLVEKSSSEKTPRGKQNGAEIAKGVKGASYARLQLLDELTQVRYTTPLAHRTGRRKRDASLPPHAIDPPPSPGRHTGDVHVLDHDAHAVEVLPERHPPGVRRHEGRHDGWGGGGPRGWAGIPTSPLQRRRTAGVLSPLAKRGWRGA